MATEIRKVVKAGYETFYEDAEKRLANLDNEIEAKVAEYRVKVLEEVRDDKARLENILEMCQEEKEFEVEEPVVEEIIDEVIENPEQPVEEVVGE